MPIAPTLAKRNARAGPAALARFRLRVTAGERILVGPGKIALLEAIDETRSITAAAKAMGMSYRRAWILVDEMNRALAKPVVASATGGERGGGSALTAFGSELVAVYRRIEKTAERACAADLARLLALASPRRAPRAAPRRASGERRRSRSTP